MYKSCYRDIHMYLLRFYSSFFEMYKFAIVRVLNFEILGLLQEKHR